MTTEKKLVLFDGMALAYRAYFAMSKNPRFTSDRKLNTSAVYGFTNTLLDILDKTVPSHAGVAFDVSGPTFRHKIYPEYKAQRQPTPEDLLESIPFIYQIVEAFRLPVLTCPGYEADDIIGTLATRAAGDGATVYLVTPDKDFAQLVTPRIKIYKISRQGPDILDEQAICEKWGIQHPEQVIDILGLAGDQSDNIPGVPGVGPVTAKKLVAQYGSIDEILKHSDQQKGKLRERLQENAEQARLSRILATIKKDTPIDLDWDALKCREPDAAKLTPLLERLEFRRLQQRLFSTAPPATPSPPGTAFSTPQQPDLFEQSIPAAPTLSQPATADHTTEAAPPPPRTRTLQDLPHQYQLIETAEQRRAFFAELNQQERFCFDLETTSLDPKIAEILGIAFCYLPHQAAFVALPRDAAERAEVLQEFLPLFQNPDTLKIGHNLKFDLSVLKWRGIEVEGPFFDTMLAHYILTPEAPHNLDQVALECLNYQPIPITDLIGPKGENQRTLAEVDRQKVTEYAGEDADVAFQLYLLFSNKIKETGQQALLQDIECPLVPVLTDMQHAGIRIDRQALADCGRKLQQTADTLQREIIQEAGMDFNVDSPKQLGDVLFNHLQLEKKPKKTKGGKQYATGEPILERLAIKHPIARKVLDFRHVRKLKNTYVDTLPDTIFPQTQRVHTEYNQAVTVTGRLQSNHPNLQNIPIRSAEGREIRRAFIARDDGHVLISADYSQIELRIIAALSQDQAMLDAFNTGGDIHRETAARVFNVAPELVSDDMRRQAKMVNFGIAYGISAYGLSQRLGIKRKNAAKLIEDYFLHYPNIKKYMDETINFARQNGYVTTLCGRRRYLRDINSKNAAVRSAEERNAVNTPIQGTAADMIKLAMIRIHHALKQENFQTQMLLQVHDELIFDAPKNEVDTVIPLIDNHMRHAMTLPVPLEVSIGVGDNWLEAH